MGLRPPRLMSMADLTPQQIMRLLGHAKALKVRAQATLPPRRLIPHVLKPNIQKGVNSGSAGDRTHSYGLNRTLEGATIALLFLKRSTRTRVSAETAATLLGGQALFLGRDDIQLGVNESVRDTARVIGGMCQGIFARVGDHSEIEELAQYAPTPVINALSSYWHPTQVLADLLTLHETRSLHAEPTEEGKSDSITMGSLQPIRPLTVAYVGDSANVLHDMLVTYPRLGHKLQVASPPMYRPPKAVWDVVKSLGCDAGIEWSEDPKAAVKGADVVVTDTWISMGQEAETERRLRDFKGYQVTERLCKEGGANPNWIFLHCLPRKKYEVDDEVFYGPRSRVFHEADNRKWTIMALFDQVFGKWSLMAGKKFESRPQESRPQRYSPQNQEPSEPTTSNFAALEAVARHARRETTEA